MSHDSLVKKPREPRLRYLHELSNPSQQPFNVPFLLMANKLYKAFTLSPNEHKDHNKTCPHKHNKQNKQRNQHKSIITIFDWNKLPLRIATQTITTLFLSSELSDSNRSCSPNNVLYLLQPFNHDSHAKLLKVINLIERTRSLLPNVQ